MNIALAPALEVMVEKRESQLRVFGIGILGIFFTLSAACAVAAERGRGQGYGQPPEAPAKLIAPYVKGHSVDLLTRPDPYFVREDGRWLYGWRVCARLDGGARIGFFLIRDGRVALAAVSDGSRDTAATVRARQFCAARLAGPG